MKTIWSEIKSDKLAFFCLFFFVSIVVVIFVWAALIDLDYVNRVNLRARDLSPRVGFPLGTDPLGRSVLPLLVVGARNSLVIAFTVAFFSSVIGIVVGLFAGFYGGRFDNLLMRLIDFFTMLPTFMVIMMLLTVMGGTIFSMTAVFIVFGWIGTARLTRMVTLQQSALEYVKASKTLGTPNIIIIFREILPNIISFIVINLTLTIAGTIGIETGLTMLGFGLPLTTPSLGHLISWAMNPLSMQMHPWQWLPSALFILIMVLCINYVGQALNRAADVKRRRSGTAAFRR
ncbi:MAG: ABC transporter permease [Defluviitaleaceae bacterium]|nr:ABC transporter permease [Defluviitaleaceae bacterium]